MTIIRGSDSTLLGRVRTLVGTYRLQGLATVGVLATLGLVASQVFPEVEDFVLESGVLPYLTLLLVIDIAASLQTQPSGSTVDIKSDQDQTLGVLLEAVSESQKREIDLIEYAAITTLPLLRALAGRGFDVRLLVRHPDVEEGLQRQRVIANLDTLYNSVFTSGKATFEARCYRLPPSLRGRHLHSDLLEIGWFTPDPSRRTTRGDSNPSVIVDISKGKNDFVRQFFVRTFDELWEHSGTEDARDVLLRLAPP